MIPRPTIYILVGNGDDKDLDKRVEECIRGERKFIAISVFDMRKHNELFVDTFLAPHIGSDYFLKSEDFGTLYIAKWKDIEVEYVLFDTCIKRFCEQLGNEIGDDEEIKLASNYVMEDEDIIFDCEIDDYE
jgi:hypothetical protein